MRNIRFRAWDKEGKRMVNLEEYRSFIIYAEGGFEIVDNDGMVREENEFEIMQFTGLKDRNNKDIYEGDIVICDRYDSHDQFKVTVDDIGNLPRWLFGSSLNWCEVIGNIYESINELDHLKNTLSKKIKTRIRR